jgi:hypothetical protein
VRTGVEFVRKVWPVTGTVEFVEVRPRGQVEWRRALVYPLRGDAARGWRLSIEHHPHHGEAASGWYGGIVLWRHDAPTAEEIEPHAIRWVRDGRY